MYHGNIYIYSVLYSTPKPSGKSPMVVVVVVVEWGGGGGQKTRTMCKWGGMYSRAE